MNSLTIPTPVSGLLSRLPVYPGSVLFSHGMNLGLRPLLREDLRALLLQKTVCIAVTDARLAFHFKWDGERFRPVDAHAHPDLKISAGAEDFIRLARRQEDPDTLFFNRRLVMEGDTELGLAVKNMLDAMESPILRNEDLGPSALVNTILSKLAGKRGGARTGNR